MWCIYHSNRRIVLVVMEKVGLISQRYRILHPMAVRTFPFHPYGMVQLAYLGIWYT